MGEATGLLTIALVCGLAVAIVVVVAWADGVEGRRAAMDATGGAGPPTDVRMYRRRRGAESVGTSVGEGMGVTISDEAERDLRASLAEISRQQGQTAVILERLTNRIDTLDEWRKQQEEDRRTRGYQSFWRSEGQVGQMRGWFAFSVALAALLINVAQHIHWQ